jgi:glycosyltransferase involved in cell wall biosynthesis
MRVIHIITRLVVGGAQENTIATVLGLRQRSAGGPPASPNPIEVRLISGPTIGPEGSLESRLQAVPGGLPPEGGTPSLVIIPELVRPVHPLKDWLALRQLEKILRAQRPDIVHTHSGKAGILGRLAARRAGVPVVIHTIHGPSFGNFQNAASNFIFRTAEKYAAGATTHFIVVAEAMKDQYLAAGIGRPEQYTKIVSGFALEPFLGAKNDPELRRELGIAPDDFVVGKIARLFKLKGHDDLFAVAPELVRRNPKFKFLLIGDGEWRAKFEGMAKSLHLQKHFIFAGLVPPAEVPRHVGIMDALVHLSLREGLPRALPQALAAGKPVVAYDCDGAREICRDGETGFLAPAGDLITLKNRLLQLAGDASLREKFGRSGAAFVRENFAVEKMVEAIYNLYLKLMASRQVAKP